MSTTVPIVEVQGINHTLYRVGPGMCYVCGKDKRVVLESLVSDPFREAQVSRICMACLDELRVRAMRNQ
jgi:hypothetical protein